MTDHPPETLCSHMNVNVDIDLQCALRRGCMFKKQRTEFGGEDSPCLVLVRELSTAPELLLVRVSIRLCAISSGTFL